MYTLIFVFLRSAAASHTNSSLDSFVMNDRHCFPCGPGQQREICLHCPGHAGKPSSTILKCGADFLHFLELGKSTFLGMRVKRYQVGWSAEQTIVHIGLVVQSCMHGHRSISFQFVSVNAEIDFPLMIISLLEVVFIFSLVCLFVNKKSLSMRQAITFCSDSMTQKGTQVPSSINLMATGRR